MTERDDDDYLAGPVPEPDAEASSTERAHAKTFAGLVDKALAGRTPAAMSADDRALVEVATVIRAASGDVELPASRRRAAVEDALRQAVGAGSPAASGGAIVKLPRARRWAPWAIAGASSLVAVAALALLWLRAPRVRVIDQPAPAAQAQRVPTSQRSRPADALVGRIAVERAGDAATRIDTIFADRLDGYRERRLAALDGGKP